MKAAQTLESHPVNRHLLVLEIGLCHNFCAILGSPRGRQDLGEL